MTMREMSDADRDCPIDLDAALEYAGGDRVFLCELFTVFLEDTRVYLTTIRAAFTAGRTGDMMVGAHTVKGSLKVLGANTAASLAERLELAARASRLDGLEGDLARFEEEMGRLLRWIETQLASVPG